MILSSIVSKPFSKSLLLASCRRFRLYDKPWQSPVRSHPARYSRPPSILLVLSRSLRIVAATESSRAILFWPFFVSGRVMVLFLSAIFLVIPAHACFHGEADPPGPFPRTGIPGAFPTLPVEAYSPGLMEWTADEWISRGF